MPVIYIKLKNPSQTVYFQSIIGTYSHICWTRTEVPEEGIIKVIPTSDLVIEVRKILCDIKKEIEFEEIDFNK